jgi:small-conductance mechanosensitive channel
MRGWRHRAKLGDVHDAFPRPRPAAASALGSPGRMRATLDACGGRPRIRRLARLACWLALLAGLAIAPPLQAASPPPPADGVASDGTASNATGGGEPAKVRELLDLLADPAIQSWLKAEHAAKTAAPAEAPTPQLSSRLAAIHAHLGALVQIIPQMPNQFARAGSALFAEAQGRSLFDIVLLFLIFLGLGFGAGWLFLRGTRRFRLWIFGLPTTTILQRLVALLARLFYGVAFVTVFGLASIGAFLVFDWPPLLREILFDYLLALLELCMALVVSRFLLAPGGPRDVDVDRFRILPMERAAALFWHRRLGLLVGWFVFGYATVMLLAPLGFDLEARRLVAYILGLGLLAIGLEMIWHHPPARPATGAPASSRRHIGTWALSIYFVLLWLLWVASAVKLMWLLAIVVALPWSIAGGQRAVGHLLQPPGSDTAAAPSVLSVALQRGLRAVLIIGGALFLAHAWQIDLVALTSRDTVGTRLLRGLLSTVVIALVADFGWQLAKTAIDRKIAEKPATADPNTDEWRRHARLKTLLPIFRNLLFIILLVMVALMGLAALGVDIGPLVAGASVVGVAIGFGAQTLVKDIISGMFYLLDDAFRVGEYIQSGNFKGTVESFSLRSVKLRHHRGPLYTVPFGTLGAVQNMSRDWVIDKLSVGITYDSDLAKVKRIMKQVGKELMEDPEIAPKMLEPLKMQGVEQFGDFAIQIRMKMMTKPGEQFVIRRRAYSLIKQAFDANGIKFAFPTVQVAGGEPVTPAAIASAGQQAFKPVVEEA